jgi:hypothetical protein
MIKEQMATIEKYIHEMETSLTYYKKVQKVCTIRDMTKVFSEAKFI